MSEEHGGAELSSKLHSVSKHIRSVVKSEQFDLHGYDGVQVENLVHAAFSTPMQVPEMVRISFVIGGGKKCRQNYSPSLPKELTDALRGIGFTEDRGGACVLEAQGTYKQQHDTGKDLKYMHVYPKVEIIQAEEDKPETLSEIAEAGTLPPVLQAATCPLEVFEGMINLRAPSFYAQRKVLRGLKMVAARVAAVEAKMVSREDVSAEDTELYEMVQAITDKVAHLTAGLESMVEQKRLTRGEKRLVIEEWKEKIASFEEELKTADAKHGKKLQAGVEALKKKIEDVEAIKGYKADNAAVEAEIKKIRTRIAALDTLEKSKQILSLDELKKVATRDGMKEQIALLETGNGRLWFVDEIKQMEKDAAPAPAPAAAKPWPASAASSSSGGNDGWSTAGKVKQPVGKPASHGGGKKVSGANMFALLSHDG